MRDPSLTPSPWLLLLPVLIVVAFFVGSKYAVSDTPLFVAIVLAAVVGLVVASRFVRG